MQGTAELRKVTNPVTNPTLRGTIQAWWDRVCPLLPAEVSQLDLANGVGRPVVAAREPVAA